jgi:hypothetical protein
VSTRALHSAYGSNMSCALMRQHYPQARPLGIVVLTHHRFIAMAASSVESKRPEVVACRLLAPSRHRGMSAQVSLMGEKRTTFARNELFSF